MSCGKYESLIALYVEGDIDGRQARKVEAHIACCAACRQFAGEIRESQAQLRELPPPQADPWRREQLRQSVMDRLEAEGVFETEPRSFIRFPVCGLRWQYAALLLFGLMAAVALAVISGHNSRKDEETVRAAPRQQSVPAPPLKPQELAAAPAPGGQYQVTQRTPKKGTPEKAGPAREAGRKKRVEESPVEVPSIELASVTPAKDGTPEQQTIKVTTKDPNVVIYWIVENDGGTR